MARLRKTEEAVSVTATPSLEDYIASREAQKIAFGVVLVKVTHPEGDSRIFPGRYSGIVLERGPAGCVWSDGTTE